MTHFGTLPRLAIPTAFLSLFMLPWPVTIALMALAGLAYPPAALIVGLAADIIYHPGVGTPLGTLWGASIALAAFGVREFLERRILAP